MMLLTSVICLLVSDDQAQDLLLLPELTELEDWEAPLPTDQSQIELQTLPSDSQVFMDVLPYAVIISFSLILRFVRGKSIQHWTLQ